MSTDKWKQAEDLFHAALELDPSLRIQFVRDQCTDSLVCDEVLSLLAAHQDARSLIQTPVPLTIAGVYEDEDLLASGEMIGAYKILNEIGRGGMGAVYLALRADQTYEKQVAIKLLKRGMDSGEVLRHFRAERQILADFDHPNIARLLDGGTAASGLPYFVMEYVQGEPIDVYCDHNRFTVTQRLELFRQVCGAVSYAHRHLVIHRDIKPSNILVTPEGVPKLLDFGIAKILYSQGQERSTVTSIRLMTPEYASPEQALGSPVTTVSDVYSLGVLLFELLSGRLPYHLENRSALEAARVISETQPPLLSTTLDGGEGKALQLSDARNSSVDQLKRRFRGDLDNIVRMALRKEPQRRYQSVEQFSEDVRRHLIGLPVIARKDTVVYRVTRFAKRNKFTFAAAIFVLLTLIAGVVATTWQARKAKAEQMQADFAREFGDDLRYLDSLLMSTYTAPRHDTRKSIALARNHLQKMETRTANGGPWAYGSGNNAVGNGYLILKDYEKAKTHLQNAWNSGYREPSTAYSLGKVLGILYLQAITGADHLSNRQLKEQIIQDAEVKYAQQAVHYLSEARTYAESPAYVEGLIALYQKRFQEALTKTSEALESSSRPDEVIKLEGDIHFAIGRQLWNTGEIPQALEAFSLAGKAYEHATERARSDPDVYLANARRYIRTIAAGKTEVQEEIRTALQLCDFAIEINPDNDQPYLAKSDIYLQQGIQQMYHSAADPRPAFHNMIAAAVEAAKKKSTATAYDRASAGYLRIAEYESAVNADSRESLRQAIAQAENALKIEPHFIEALVDRASAYFYVGEYQLANGENPTSSYAKVISTYEKDLKEVKKDSFSYNLLAFAYIGFAEYKLKHGLDPRNDLATATETYRQGLRMSPNAFHLYQGLGLILVDLAKYEMDHGISPDKSFQDAIANYNKSLEPAPGGYGIYNRGAAFMTRAEHKIRMRQDPQEDLNLGMNDFDVTLKEYDVTPAMLQKAAIFLLQARSQFLSEKNPDSDLDQARKLAANYLKTNPELPEALLIAGKIDALSARQAMKTGRDAGPLFEEAAAKIKRSIDLNRNEIQPYVELCSIYRWRAEWTIQAGKSADSWIELGLQTISDGEKVYPQHPELLAIHGTLLLLKNRTVGSPELKKQGSDLIRQALRINRFLESDYSVLQ